MFPVTTTRTVIKHNKIWYATFPVCASVPLILSGCMSLQWHVSAVQKRLNEDAIDYELLEELICHIDDTCNEGAILVFLPVS